LIWRAVSASWLFARRILLRASSNLPKFLHQELLTERRIVAGLRKLGFSDQIAHALGLERITKS
jgi:hypothetical protein